MADAVRCRALNRLLAVLLIIDAKTGAVLGIWYEGCKEWEVECTAELIEQTYLEF